MISGMLLLLAILYLAFVGLGIPDSLIGAAWPAIYPSFGISDKLVSIITFTISGCTVFSSIVSDRLLIRFGTWKITVFSTTVTALALFGYGCSDHFIWLCLLSIPLGLGAGAIDSGLNHFISTHYPAKYLNFLHAFYGIGVSFSPYVMSMAIRNRTWQSGYRIAALVQLGIALILFVSCPLWMKYSSGRIQGEEDVRQEVLPLGKMKADRNIRLMWLIMFATNAIEYVCGTWGATFLVEGRGIAVSSAAALIALFYMGMAFGRLVSGILSDIVSSRVRMIFNLALLLAAVLLMVIPLPALGSYLALFLIGFGNGPIYPTLIQKTSDYFGAKWSQSIIGTEIAAAYIGVMVTPAVFGWISGILNINVFPYFLLTWFLILTAALMIFVRNKRAEKERSGDKEDG